MSNFDPFSQPIEHTAIDCTHCADTGFENHPFYRNARPCRAGCNLRLAVIREGADQMHAQKSGRSPFEPGLEAFPEADSMQMGWNDCRAHIFGDAQ